MNLPNYFLADLPPEATLSPTMIAEACHTLKRNREKYLMSRTTDDLVKILCEVAAEWLQQENKFRRLAPHASTSVHVTRSPNAGRPSCRHVSGGFCIWPSGQIRVAPQRAKRSASSRIFSGGAAMPTVDTFP